MNHTETVTELTMNKTEQMEIELCAANSKITVLEGTIEILKWNVSSKPLAKSQLWSTYKHRQTIKMLIGILNLLLPYVILADRRFILQVEVALI